METVFPKPHLDEDVEVTIALPRSILERAWEIVRANDPELCPLHAMDGRTTLEDFLRWVIEQNVR
jgi:hypothetical protein